jgi:hypothetical protein
MTVFFFLFLFRLFPSTFSLSSISLAKGKTEVKKSETVFVPGFDGL